MVSKTEVQFIKGLPNSLVKYKIKEVTCNYDDGGSRLDREISNTNVYEPKEFLQNWEKLFPEVATYGKD